MNSFDGRLEPLSNENSIDFFLNLCKQYVNYTSIAECVNFDNCGL